MIPGGIDGIARIGLMFLDGDAFEEVLIDQLTHTDYRFDPFNRLRACLNKIERLDPDLDVSAILWRFIPGNPYVAEPLVAGNALPDTGWRRVFANPRLREAYATGGQTTLEYKGGYTSHYYALHNSDQDVVGVLELLVGRGYRKDVDSCEMFMEPLDEADEDEAEERRD